MNNHPLINEETRKNIQEYASKMGYQRNSLSVGLRHSKSGVLGVIVPTRRLMSLPNPPFSAYFNPSLSSVNQ